MEDALDALSRLAGIAPRYTDLRGAVQDTLPETRRALLAAMGFAADSDAALADSLAAETARRDCRTLPEWIVAEAGAPPGLAPEADWALTAEDGTVTEGRGPLPSLPMGRYRLDSRGERAWVLSAPSSLPLPARGWGVTAPLYGLRGAPVGGIGDYRDLRDAAVSLAGAGAGFLGINPVHAGFGADPDFVSPYSPSHRRRLSTRYIHVSGEPPGVPGPFVDYATAVPARQAALEAAFAADGRGAGDAEFAAFRSGEGDALRDFAIYEALAERHGPTWDRWPEALRVAGSAEVRAFADASPDRIAFHEWLQYRADRQLAEAGAAAKAAGMAHGLYLDLAVGTDLNGAETWAAGTQFARGVSLGAPPDDLGPDGQTWNLAPFNPRALAETGFAPLAETLAFQFRYAGMLRIDHMIGFNRAFWVPMDDAPGAYVTMPQAAMLAVVRIEAARAGAVVVGEDLGIVPEGLQDALAESGILGCALTMFGEGRAPGDYRERALASFGSHDLPPFRGWAEGREILERRRMGKMTAEATEAALEARTGDVARLAGTAGGPTIEDLHDLLGRCASRLVALQAEDILGVASQANMPGTVSEYPNWRRQLPVSAQELGNDDRTRRHAGIMARHR